MEATTAVLGPTLPTWAPQQGGCYPGYTGRDANFVAEAAFDPNRTRGPEIGTAVSGARCARINSPVDAGDLLTRSWSYRMMSNFGPSGQTQLFGRPAYQLDAERARAPIEVIAGSADEQFFAENYASAFAGVTRPVSVKLAAGGSHMAVLSDPRALPMIRNALKEDRHR